MTEAILLVDDEPAVLSALRRALRDAGYPILTAQDAAEALALLEKETVAVVLSDQRMPGLTGSALLAQVRERYPDVVRLVLSGYADADGVIAAVNEGAVYKYLTKPWDNEALCATVRDAVRHHQLQRERRQMMEEIEAANIKLAQINTRLRALVEDKDKALAFAATHDSITGLPNRVLFEDRLQQALAHARRWGSSVAVVSLGLDGFGQINDALGHALGDAVLCAASTRLGARLRSVDTLARTSGDGFSIVLCELVHPDNAAGIVTELLDDLSAPFLLGGHELFLSASAGICTASGDGNDAQALLHQADLALHHAKEEMPGSCRFYTENINQGAHRRLTLEAALRRALERGEFTLHYQPQANLEAGTIVGVEALLRWQHPERGVVSPGEFIPVLEQTGLIVPVGEWVLRTACAQARRWHDDARHPLRMAVNLSAVQFRQADLVGMVERTLRETGIDPILHGLELELTESLLMRDVERNADTLQRLVDMGIKLSVDDFGTGYSSLSYLKRFPIHTLKIDQSFVRDMVESPEDAAIVGAVVALGHSLHLDVIAEGVETEGQRARLRALGCDEIQGFLLSPPLAPDLLMNFLQAGCVSQTAFDC